MDRTDRDARAPSGPDLRLEDAGPRMIAAVLDVFGNLDLAEQLRAMLRHALAWTGAEAGFALAPDEDRQALVPVVAEKAKGEWDLTGSRLALAELKRWADAGEATPSVAEWFGDAVPASSALIVVRGEMAGVTALLVLVSPRAAGATLAEVRSLVSFSRRAVENSLQVRAIRELVIKDDTVECFNRRYFEEFLAEELARASRFHAPLSLIFFDMDGLKQVNSLLGHAMGSRALFEVSLRVRGKVRKFDKLFRFGGDEFCIVLPETEWHGALEVAERVRVAIAGKPFLVDSPAERGGIKMTASFGIASFPLHARTKGELLERADWAMQLIKNGVKNSIAVAEIVEEARGE